MNLCKLTSFEMCQVLALVQNPLHLVWYLVSPFMVFGVTYYSGLHGAIPIFIDNVMFYQVEPYLFYTI